VLRGSFLIIENLDRLSREHIQPALLLALNLLQAGIRVVQLSPAEMVFDDQSDTMPVMMMMVELSRGHGESAIKSVRCGMAWVQKRSLAREDGEVMTRQLPAWVEERGDKLHLIPTRATVVKRIFRWPRDDPGVAIYAFAAFDGKNLKDDNGAEIVIARGATVARWTFIIGKDGKVAYKNTKVNPALDTKEVAAFIEKMQKL
jgi:hypothetical protein